ncbi:hypothetical protein W97_03526 [Coniosporium apollinis CBS 100218]|uniref:Yeast cell wall synthesis Kre9/Knh1-like N-terminal domain-containing protein n=1 Tax=Coniosporium apollinis (strain CBS 100218) TaxID=1168221 RepID=R7YQU5_CONA1|nr:uncharacterized protein W97_03526 [Coniosporium apollinis CBS 100218]EON64295.1 hypothetical protein W97_03526 [Coniosporium apollinis CBS 100218]
MRFFQAILAASAFVGSALAQTNLALTSVPSEVVAGNTYTITYTAPDLDQPVTITLRKGDPNNLNTIGELTSDATGGSYTWIPSTSLADGEDYALQITQDNQINYSGLISLSGGNSAAVSSASSASASSSSVLAAITSSASVASQVSSIESVIASLNSTLAAITNATMTTPVVAPTGNLTSMARNTTMATATLTSTRSASSGAVTSRATLSASATESSGVAVPSGNAAAGLGYASPFALIFGAVAAMAYL